MNPLMANDRKRRDVVSIDEGAMRVGSSVVPITGLGNDRVLAIFVDTVRKQRNLTPTAAIELRNEDLDVLASALDLSDRKLRARLTRVVGLSSAEAASVHHALLRRRAVAGAATLSLGAAGVFGVVATGGPHPVTPPSATVSAPAHSDAWLPPTTEVVKPITVWPAPSTAASLIVPTTPAPPTGGPATLAPPRIGDAVTIEHAEGPTPEVAVPTFPSDTAPDIGDPESITSDTSP